jgi:outer membrane immunogenic protein
LFDDIGDFARHSGLGADGVFGTLIAGYDWQVSPSTVFGLFVDYDFSNASHSFALPDFLIASSTDHDSAWAIGARLGWLSSPSTLWYLTGGYTQADFDSSVTIDDVRFSRSRTFDGYFAGVGVDTRLAASNWFLRLEYRYSQFDGERLILDDDDTGLGHHFEPTIHTARLTLTYKFGGGYGWGWGTWGQ